MREGEGKDGGGSSKVRCVLSICKHNCVRCVVRKVQHGSSSGISVQAPEKSDNVTCFAAKLILSASLSLNPLLPYHQVSRPCNLRQHSRNYLSVR